MEIDWVPLVMFIVLGVVFTSLFWFRYKIRVEMQQTIRSAMDKGQELTPEIIDRLGSAKPAKDRDLRYGTIWMSLAIGLVLIGIIVPEPEAFRGCLAGAAFPFCIGMAYLILHKVTDKE